MTDKIVLFLYLFCRKNYIKIKSKNGLLSTSEFYLGKYPKNKKDFTIMILFKEHLTYEVS